MGIEASYLRITPSDWERIQALAVGGDEVERETAYLEFIDSEGLTSGDRYLSIEKEWHVLHALLTGDVDNPWEIKPSPQPLGNVVMGGTETPFNATYGKVRILSPEEVREVADAIKNIAVDELMSRFDPVTFTKAEVYPNPRPGGWTSKELEPARFYFPQLVDFFGKAAEEGELVLLSFD